MEQVYVVDMTCIKYITDGMLYPREGILFKHQ